MIPNPLQALDENSHAPRYKQLRDILARRIAQHEWRPGDALPSESELTAQYGLATGTVRRAMEELIADGIVERMHGRGSFVRRASFDNSLFRFFRYEETDGQQARPSGRILACEEMLPPAQVAAVLKIGLDTPALHIERQRVVDGSVRLLEDIWLDRTRFVALLSLSMTNYTGLLYPLYDQEAGQVVASARETLSIETGRPKEAALLGVDADASLVVVERVAFGFDGEALEWRQSCGPADRFRYSIEIR